MTGSGEDKGAGLFIAMKQLFHLPTIPFLTCLADWLGFGMVENGGLVFGMVGIKFQILISFSLASVISNCSIARGNAIIVSN